MKRFLPTLTELLIVVMLMAGISWTVVMWTYARPVMLYAVFVTVILGTMAAAVWLAPRVRRGRVTR